MTREPSIYGVNGYYISGERYTVEIKVTMSSQKYVNGRIINITFTKF